eukprot:m.82702 g.82702  ORF g.82702 m.82702 type:complete len:891 (+) comp25548_c0_seq1:285-2957(+)
MALRFRCNDRFVGLIIHHTRSSLRCGTNVHARVCKQGAALRSTTQLRRFASSSLLRYPENVSVPEILNKRSTKTNILQPHRQYRTSRDLMRCIAALSKICDGIQIALDGYTKEFQSLEEVQIEMRKEISLPPPASDIKRLQERLAKTHKALLDVHDMLCDRTLPNDILATTVTVVFKLVDICEFAGLLACAHPAHRIMGESEQITVHNVLTPRNVRMLSNGVQDSVLLAFTILGYDFDDRFNAQTKHRLMMSCAKTLCAPDLIQLHIQKSSALIPSLDSSQLADFAWACATCCVESPVTFRAIAEASSSFENDYEAICRTTWAFAVLNMRSQVSPLLEHAAKVLPEMIEKDEIPKRLLADFLWGCMRLNAPSFKIAGLDHVFTLVSSRLHTVSSEQEDYFDTLYIVAALAGLKVPITAHLGGSAHKLLKTLGVAPLRGASLSLLFDPAGVRQSIVGGDSVFSKEKRITMDVGKGLQETHDRDVEYRYMRAMERQERGYTDGELAYNTHKRDNKDIKEYQRNQEGRAEAISNFEIDTRLQALILMAQTLKMPGVRIPEGQALFEEMKHKVGEIEAQIQRPVNDRISLRSGSHFHDNWSDDCGDDNDGDSNGGDDGDDDVGGVDGPWGKEERNAFKRQEYDLFDLLIRQAHFHKNNDERPIDYLLESFKKILPFTLGDQTDVATELDYLLDIFELEPEHKQEYLQPIGTSLKGLLTYRSNLRFKGRQLSLIEQRTLDWEHLPLGRIRAICCTLNMSSEGTRKKLVASLIAMGVHAEDHVIASDVGTINIEKQHAVKFDKFRVRQLVEFCKQHDLLHHGTKPELIARLKDSGLSADELIKTMRYATAEDWETCSMVLLQSVCQHHNIDNAGSKQALVDRILRKQSLSETPSML